MSVAANLYSSLHSMDKADVDEIFSMGLEIDNDVAATIMNRMLKASGHNVVKC